MSRDAQNVCAITIVGTVLKDACAHLLKANTCKIRAVAKVIGLMISSAPTVQMAMPFYRTLEMRK